MSNNLLFELLQVAIGTQAKLTSRPGGEEWASLFVSAKQQQIVGILYTSILRLPEEQRPQDKLLFLKWHGLASKIVQRSEELSRLSDLVVGNIQTAGFDCLLLKGQSLLVYYPEQLREYRASGDIDLWARKDGMTMNPNNAVYQYVRSFRPLVKSGYIHIDFPILPNTDLEVHIRPCYLANPWHNRRLQKWFEIIDIRTLSNDRAALSSFNVVFLLLHLYKHFIHEGATIRQLMDYYFVLKANGTVVDETLLRSFGALSFYQDVMPVMSHVFEGDEIKSGRSLWLLQELMSPISREGNWWKRKISRALTLVRYYPDEVMWQPLFSLYSRLFWDRAGGKRNRE